MMKPNLFQIATSELSQDAFLTWLFRFADLAYAESYVDLHECGKALIQALFKTHGIEVEKITHLKVKRQHKHIDIWLEVNQEYVIVIEDKTNTKQHGKQLENYKKVAEKHKLLPILIYLKTGNDSQANLRLIQNKFGFKPFVRSDLLAVLNEFKFIQNDIFQDYLYYLNYLEILTQEYVTKPVKNWKHSYMWQGFFQLLEQELPKYNMEIRAWRTTSQGRIQSAELYRQEWQEHSIYLQIEQDKLCFKLKTKNTDKSFYKKLHRQLWQHLQQSAQHFNVSIESAQFRLGDNITLARIAPENWLFSSKCEYLDSEFVLQQLEKYQLFFKQTFFQTTL